MIIAFGVAASMLSLKIKFNDVEYKVNEMHNLLSNTEVCRE